MHCLQLCKEGNRLPLPLITEEMHLKRSFKSIAFGYILYNRRQCKTKFCYAKSFNIAFTFGYVRDVRAMQNLETKKKKIIFFCFCLRLSMRCK